MTDRRCETCAFFYPLKKECRRYPPKISAITAPGPALGTLNVQFVGARPSVEPTDFCGEYEGKGGA